MDTKKNISELIQLNDGHIAIQENWLESLENITLDCKLSHDGKKFIEISYAFHHSSFYHFLKKHLDEVKGITERKNMTLKDYDQQIDQTLQLCREKWPKLYFDEHMDLIDETWDITVNYDGYVNALPKKDQKLAKYGPDKKSIMQNFTEIYKDTKLSEENNRYGKLEIKVV
jgi:hypothetical protein